jgi:hypothetical protein
MGKAARPWQAPCAAMLGLVLAAPAAAQGFDLGEAAAFVICAAPGTAAGKIATLEGSGWVRLPSGRRDTAISAFVAGKTLEYQYVNGGLALAEARDAAVFDLQGFASGQQAGSFRFDWLQTGSAPRESHMLLWSNSFMTVCDIALGHDASMAEITALTGLAATNTRPLAGGVVTTFGPPDNPMNHRRFEPDADAFAQIGETPVRTMVSIKWVGTE